MIRIIPVLLFFFACNHQTVPMVNCSEEFRDTWWLLDPDVTGNLGAQSDVCIYVGSDGLLDIRSAADEHFGPFKWECQNTDYYRMNGRGHFSAILADSTGEAWHVNVEYHGILNKYSYATPCWFMEE